ncbi:hypothetical protein [Lysinibacter sp. HNR]|uniref:hypothetical protein n=1 Tax=Lysinibacter sp. HNR TaxID=3031408 RepID=UPI002435AD8E|nr:hypothetical protein [Lysinibacter sp. HNR]WGD38170.1 hypothetical protein FrondiHNR_04440 [Lysinibacter sp. HNR]
MLIVFRLRRESRHELIEIPVRVSPFESRVWPFLLAGFLLLVVDAGPVPIVDRNLVDRPRSGNRDARLHRRAHPSC